MFAEGTCNLPSDSKLKEQNGNDFWNHIEMYLAMGELQRSNGTPPY
jgi:hypothetical protein